MKQWKLRSFTIFLHSYLPEHSISMIGEGIQSTNQRRHSYVEEGVDRRLLH